MLKEKVKRLPRTPGVYLMKDYLDEIIYVGKAKHLKDRVSSYFQKNQQHSKKVLRMVRNIHDFEVIHVDTELDALLLECQLIQQYHPMYNRMMNYYKNYLYISYSQQTFSLSTEASAECYGPFKNYKRLPELLVALSETYLLKTVSPITRLIIEAQLPEIKQLTIEEKNSEILGFLSGENKKVLSYLKKRQAYCIEQMNFEYAQKLQTTIKQMESFIFLINQQKDTLAIEQQILSLPIDGSRTKHYLLACGRVQETLITPTSVDPSFTQVNKKILAPANFIEKSQIDPLYILSSYVNRVKAKEISGIIRPPLEKGTDKN
ncbi:excinuclease ABC subunit C [Enterococcus sp. AZ194]|uniref:GIY-YIG nuclease family protein n=1 Tax=Enterococcus sp. AZ194 TaxID=2774629 RepID=UPI003F27B02C